MNGCCAAANAAPAARSHVPSQNVAIRKVKVLKSPKFDLTKLMEVHGDYTEEVPAKVERPAAEAAPAEDAE